MKIQIEILEHFSLLIVWGTPPVASVGRRRNTKLFPTRTPRKLFRPEMEKNLKKCAKKQHGRQEKLFPSEMEKNLKKCAKKLQNNFRHGR